MGGVVHCQHDAGDELDPEHERKDGSESPPIVQVPWRRIGHELGINQLANRQPLLQPLQKRTVRLVSTGPVF